MKPGVKRRIGIADTHGNRRVTVSACLELVLSQVPSLMDQVLDGLRLAAGLDPHKPAGRGGLRPALKPVIPQLLDKRDSLRNAL